MSNLPTVLLQTADRSDYTIRTVDSFLDHNKAEDFRLFVADDGSEDVEGTVYAMSKGFTLIHRTLDRRGCTATLREAIQALKATTDPDDLVLYLQNDIETVRPIPVDEAKIAISLCGVSSVRLWGDWKGRPGGPRAREPHGSHRYYWEPLRIMGEDMGLSKVHWSHLPAISPYRVIESVTRDAASEKDAWSSPAWKEALVARFNLNVIYHIGEERTPNGKYRERPGTTREKRQHEL